MKQTLRLIKKQYTIHIFIWLGLTFLLLFSIVPMFGLLISFKEYNIRDGISGYFTGEFVGLKYFREFIFDRKFVPLMVNTLSINLLKLFFSFPLPILFAILLNEMRGQRFKKVVQTVSYLPHFISWVIVAGVLFSFFSTSNGLINELGLKLGILSEPLDLLINPDKYYFLAVSSEVWKETGWNAIIYLAAIAGIDPSIYESAQIDGAGRLQKILYITLPSFKGTMSIILILSIGNLLSAANFDQAMLLSNPMNISRAEILEVYIYKTGLGLGRYSYAAAAGLFQSVISFVLVLTANRLSRKFSGTALF